MYRGDKRARRIISAVTAAGFFVNSFTPAAYAATDIQKANGNNGTITNNGNVYQIWADKEIGSSAVNVFSQFNLDSNNIANMYFGTKGGSANRDNLVNFVNSKIDINGTVNAIRGGKLGGNLFFLSKDGMAVGKTGVINAGSLTAITPTGDFYDDIVGENGRIDDDAFTSSFAKIQKGEVPINSSGTITVAGQINAPDGINIRAAQITAGSEAELRTDVTGLNFADLVNIGTVKADINDTKLTATQNANGDIVLAAYADTANEMDESFNHYDGTKNLTNAYVKSSADIISRGDVTMTAEAVRGVALGNFFTNAANQVADVDVYGKLAKNTATVEIGEGSTVTGNHVDIQAKTVNNYIASEASVLDKALDIDNVNQFVGLIGPNMNAAYGVLKNESTVTIGKDAVVTANAAKEEGKKALNISAASDMKLSVGAATAAIKLANLKQGMSNVPAAAVTYAKTDNNAAVNIDGTLKSNGNVNIEAKADNTMEAAAVNKTTKLGGDTTTQINVGVAVANGDNNAAVNISKDAKISGTNDSGVNGDVKIVATATNSVDTQALVTGREESLAATAVNVTNYDTKADVNIDANIAAHNVDITAGNTTLKNNVIADNSVGATMLMSKVTGTVSNAHTTQSIKDAFTEFKKTMFGELSVTDQTLVDKAGELVSVGASVAVANESTAANVKIGDNVKITAENADDKSKGNVNITANNVIADTQMKANGISSNYNDESKNKVLVNASVLYADMDNNSSVVFGSGSSVNGGNVNIQANNEFQYNRVNKMIGDVLLLCEKLKGAYGSNTEYGNKLAELQAKAEEYKTKLASDPNYADSAEGNEAALTLAASASSLSDDSVTAQITDIFLGPLSVAGAAAQFADVSNYANFYAGSSVGGKDTNNATLGVAGTANVTYLNNKANIIVGKNADITASGKLNLDSYAVQKDVALTGKLFNTGGADTAVGGNLALHTGNVSSIAAVAEGAVLHGAAVNITADNDVSNTSIVFGAGTAVKEAGVQAMANTLLGSSVSLVSIDDEAKLTADGTGTTEKENDGSINLSSENDTTLTNVTGGLAIGTTAGIGASVGVTSYDINSAAVVGDNDYSETSSAKADDVEKVNAAQLLKDSSGLEKKDLQELLGKAETNVTDKDKKGLTAKSVNVNAHTDGMINTVTVAGGAAKSDDSNEPGIMDKISAGLKEVNNRVDNYIAKLDDQVNKYVADKPGEDNPMKNTYLQPTNPTAGQKLSSFTISGAGSVSLNFVDKNTAAYIDGANVTITDADKGALNVKAKDDSFTGAWGGAGALSWKTTTTEQNQNNMSAVIGGAAAVNEVNSNVQSIIRSADIVNASSIVNAADKSGALVAAGLGMSVSKEGGDGGTKLTVAGSASVNEAVNNIDAIMEDVTVSRTDGKTADIKNSAHNSDTQVTGGINASIAGGGQKTTGVGATVNYSNLTNNVTAKIKGGKYTQGGSIENSALTDITQVGAAVGLAVATGEQSNTAIDGVAVYNKLSNNANAIVENVDQLEAKSLSVVAKDTELDANKYNDYIDGKGLDATGKNYIQSTVSGTHKVNADNADNADNVDKDLEDADKAVETTSASKGNTIVSAALGVTGTDGGSSGLSGTVAVAINDIDNDFNAKIINSTVTTAESTDVLAESNTLLTSVAAGAAGGSKAASAAGSVSWQTLDNNVEAGIEKSTVSSSKTNVTGQSNSLNVNVAGAVGVSTKSSGVGLALAYNDLNNTTSAYVKGGTLQGVGSGASAISVNADNAGKQYAVGAGVTVAGGDAAVNGTVAINRGRNDVEAAIEADDENKGTTINNASAVTVATKDSGRQVAVAGGISGSKGATAVGGAVAYNEVGNISGSGDNKKQLNKAHIDNATITTTDSGTIAVSAKDESSLSTNAVGVGLAKGNVAVQGAASTALIKKNTEASMAGTNINADKAANNAKVDVKADSSNKIQTDAATAVVGKNTAIGAGVSVNRSESDTNAKISGGKFNVGNLRTEALNSASILTVGVGGGVSQNASVTGSVAVNKIDNNTIAKIADGADITAENNAIVNAQSDESIANYAGSATVSTSNGAAVGLSVSVNMINGSTEAAIEGNNTAVTAKGSGEADKVKDSVNDKDILDKAIEADQFNSMTSLKDDRKENSYKGTAVTASSTHTIKSFLVNGGVGVTGAAVTGTVNVNKVGGSTSAAIKGAVINTADAKGDVNVAAHDYTNSAGAVGSLAIAAKGAGVGFGSDNNTVSRSVRAEVLGKGSTDANGKYNITDRNTVNAKALNVNAEAKQGLGSLAVGAGVGAIGAGVSNGTNAVWLNGTTRAAVDGTNLNLENLAVKADHLGRINTAATAVAGSGEGAALGFGVTVVKENSNTNASMKDSAVTYTSGSGKTEVKAENATEVTAQQHDAAIVGIGGSVATTIGINNINSRVGTELNNVQLGSADNRTGSIDIGGKNTIKFDRTASTTGGGLATAAIGVNVNTIDSQVDTNVEKSNLYANGEVNITAEEERDVDQLSINIGAGGFAGGANVMITNIGKAVDSVYGYKDGNGKDDNTKVDIDSIYKSANNAVSGNALNSDYLLGGLSSDEVDTTTITPDKGASEADKQSRVKVKADGVTINTTGKFTAKAVETTNVKMDSWDAKAGGVAVGGNVGILNVHRNSGVELTSAKINANEIEVLAQEKGLADLNMYQGSASASGALNMAYGSVTSEGRTGIGIGNSSLTAAKGIDIKADDQSRTKINAVGVAVSSAAASVVVAQGTNSSTTDVLISSSDLTANAGNVDIKAQRDAKDDKGKDAESLSVKATSGSAGVAFAGAGVAATADEHGTVGVELANGTVNGNKKSNTLTATTGDININAYNAPRVRAETGGMTGSLFAAATITSAKANIGSEGNHLKTYVTIGKGNKLTADDVNIAAKADTKQNVVMQGMSIAVSPTSNIPAAAIQANFGGADVYSDVTVDLNAKADKEADGDYADNIYNGNLTVNADNIADQDVKATGITVAAAVLSVSSGTNIAGTNVVQNTAINANGSNADSKLGDVLLKATSTANVTNTAEGHGGSMADISPFAAKAEAAHKADTNVNVNGSWNTSGKFDAQAINQTTNTITADAVRAAVIGGSGTWLHNTIGNTAKVTLDGAAITSGGAQNYLAENKVTHKGTIKGSGYGGLNINAADLADDISFTAGVDIKNSTLNANGDDGSITAQALTSGTIESNNTLKSAGVIPISLAFSNHSTKYDNSINVDNSTLKTVKKEQDITLAAQDDTNVDYRTTADTQGGAIGAASAAAENSFTRSNKVSATGKTYIEAANDVNLYAGTNAGGQDSELDFNLIADAYNKTLIPLYTEPKITNNMSQSNQVTIGSGAEAASVRHINARAVKGSTTIAKSAKEYNIYKGTGGSGSLTSTASGTIEGSDEKYDNSVTNEGTLKAGIHNKLDITISGWTETNAKYKTDENGKVVYDKDGKPVIEGGVDYSNIKTEIKEGSDWFKPENIKPSEVNVKNSLKAEYDKIITARNKYAATSAEYKSLDDEAKNLLSQMEALNFIEKDQYGKSTGKPMDTNTLLGVVLPDIVVSGGNINIDSDTISSGNAVAQGAPQINITNSSDLYLQINDISIQDAGGKVRHNGSVVKDTAINDTPQINITSTSASSFANNKYAQADINILGNIVNDVGDINIKNTNYNIVVDEDATLSAQNIQLISEHGSVSQTSTKGILNIGGDPVSQRQFSQDVAEKIQKYLDDKLTDKKDYTVSFDSYADYRNWLIKEVGIDANDIPADPKDVQSDESSNPNGILAGANVYINGVNVNISGLVQAGYDDYSTALTDSAKGKIDDINSKWNGTPLADSSVMSNDKYLVNTGGARWNESKQCWDYEVKVYYNPSTQKLLVESLNPKGGQIYINGAVASTGNGRLLAMDGAADIKIDTTALADNNKVQGVVVNSIANRDIEGLISITDKAKNTVTEYKKGQSRSYAIGAADKGAFKANTDTVYDPLANQRIYYTGGYSAGQETKHSYERDFLFWGAWEINKSKELLNKIREENGTANIQTSVFNKGEGESFGQEGKGVYIAVEKNGNINNKDWYVNGSYSEVPADDSDGVDVIVNKTWGPPSWLGKALGYGTTKYEWTTNQSVQSSTTSSIAADKGIQIGFLGGSSKGDISINAGQSIELAGNISNAASRNDASKALGSVNITSQNGSITAASNANIVSDNVTLKAADSIDVHHASIGSNAVINAAAANGSISFNSSRGNLLIDQVAAGTGDISASTGNVSITAQGSILDASGGTAVKGKRIDLVSKTGTIGTTGKALNIQAGSELYSSNTMESSINASAAGDIVLTQANGDMRLGHIESTDGDVVLTASNGSFADATRNSEAGLSDSQDKIDRWLEAGLISKDDKDSENAKAAEAAKNERLAGLEERANTLAEGNADKIAEYKKAADAYYTGMADAKDTYIADVKAAKKTDEVNAAYTKYQAAQKAYFADKNFSADEQNFIASYAEVSNSSNYGWSKNQLLYAISDSVLNSEPGQTVELADKANISAKNITLNATKGGIGVDGDAKEIKSSDIMQIENLKVLAGAKGGDLTWNNGDVTVRQQKAITLNVKEGGGVTADAKDNVYLATTKESALKINGDITTTGNVKLMSGAGVELTGENASVSGVNLIIGGGTGDIGSSKKYFNTNMSGTVDANAGGSIYLHQSGDKVLTMQNAAAGEDIFITADKGMKMSTESGKDMGYLNAGNAITLVANDGNIGVKNDGMRILNNGAAVNADAKKGSVYINGQKDGTMVLGQISGSEFVLTNNTKTAEGTVKNNVTVELGNDKTDGSITANTVDIDGASLALNGTIKGKANDKADSVILRADKNISQAEGENSYINAATLHTKANGAQSLGSTANKVDAINIDSYDDKKQITGDVNFVTNANKGLAASLNGVTVNNGDVKVTNLSDNAAINVDGGITTKVDADNAGKGNVSFSGQGAFSNSGAVNSAGSYSVEAKGKISQSGAVNAGKDAVLNTTGGSIIFDNTVTAKNDVIADTKKGDITLNAKVTSSEGNILVQTADGKVTAAELAAVKDITAKTQKGDIALNNKVTSSGGNIFINTVKGSVTAANKLDGHENVEVKTESGTISLKDVSAAQGSVTAETKNGGIEIGSITANQNTGLTATAGIAVNGSVASGGTTSAATETGGIAFNSDVKSGGDVTAKANTGSIEFKGNVESTGGVKAETNDGSIAFDKLVTADTDITAKTNKGDITFKADITSNSKGINLETASGSVTAADGAALKAAGDIIAAASGGNVELKNVTSTGGKVNLETGTSGNISAGTVNAAGDVTAKADKGAITLNNKVTSSGGNVFINTVEGSITAADKLDGHESVEVKAEKSGTISLKDVSAAQGSVTANTANGDITFDGSVTSGGAVTAETKGIGGITVGTNSGINAGSIGFTTNKGAITINSDLNTTGKDGITLKAGGDEANKADISFGHGSGKDTINVNAAQGDINISITQGSVGDITDARSADYENTNLTAANIRAKEGNLTINHDGRGKVDLSQLYAKHDAKVSTADGDLHVGEIDGNLVAVLVKNANKDMKVDNIIAGTQIQIAGSDISLDDITQRVGADNMLNITPVGSDAGKPIDNFTIGNIKTNAGSGVRFDQLWVNNADINVEQGKMHVDKLYVHDKARFSNGHTTATVYGAVPQRNTGDVIYWNNTNVNNPAHDLDRWLDPSVKDNKWMYLHFTEQPNVQESNGLLVYLRDYDYVYNQRFTAENHARWLDDMHSYEVHDTYRNPGLGYFSRYNLYDTPDHSVHPIQNADEDEFEVEKV